MPAPRAPAGLLDVRDPLAELLARIDVYEEAIRAAGAPPALVREVTAARELAVRRLGPARESPAVSIAPSPTAEPTAPALAPPPAPAPPEDRP